MENIIYYASILALIVIGIFVAKRVVSCLFRSIIGILFVAAAAYIYFNFIA